MYRDFSLISLKKITILIWGLSCVAVDVVDICQRCLQWKEVQSKCLRMEHQRMVYRCEIQGSMGCTWNKNRFSDTIRQQQRILLCNILFRFGSTISISVCLIGFTFKSSEDWSWGLVFFSSNQLAWLQSVPSTMFVEIFLSIFPYFDERYQYWSRYNYIHVTSSDIF